jgi:hypothetical protein
MSDDVKNNDPLRWIQEEIRDFLLKDSWFGALTANILLADRGTILETLDIEIAKLGLAIIIEPTEADLQYSGSSIIVNFEEASPMSVIVWENVLSNRSNTGTGRRASEVAIRIAKQFRPGQTPDAPCVFRKARLSSDSNGKCIYTLAGVGRFTIA